MQSFYKIGQDQNEKVPTFTSRIKGALSQITLKYLDRLGKTTMVGHLRECLLHEMKEGIKDTLHYLNDNSLVS